MISNNYPCLTHSPKPTMNGENSNEIEPVRTFPHHSTLLLWLTLSVMQVNADSTDIPYLSWNGSLLRHHFNCHPLHLSNYWRRTLNYGSWTSKQSYNMNTFISHLCHEVLCASTPSWNALDWLAHIYSGVGRALSTCFTLLWDDLTFQDWR